MTSLREVVNELFVTNPEVLGDLDENTNKLQNHTDTDTKDIRFAGEERTISIASFTFPQAEKLTKVPDMWSWDYIGLYSQYAAVGLLYGSSGTLFSFCVYEFEGESNVCSNSRNLVFFAWNIKIFYAILTDSFRPFGLRRKPWMIAGWTMVLLILLILTIFASSMSTSLWLISLLVMQGFVMLSDVPADGYSVELGQMESSEQRGQILATGQRIRFTFSVLAGVIQTFLLNGPTTNAKDCPISFQECWSWGLTINQYYGLLLGIVFLLSLPVFWLKEIDVSHLKRHDFKYFMKEVWSTLKTLTTMNLLIFVIGTGALTNFVYNTNTYLQYYIIELTNFEAGIDTITSYLALVVAIWIFQKYLIKKNWQYTQYGSTLVTSVLELIWIAAYYNAGGTQNAWFTIFVDLDLVFFNIFITIIIIIIIIIIYYYYYYYALL
jgi:hypothetical protein